MPARSEQQQKLFGLALSVKRGETPRSDVSKDVLKIVDTMSEKEIEDFSGTSHENLPKKVEEFLKSEIRNYVRPIIGEGRAFVAAAKKAKEEGKTEFEFNGKTYPVTIKESLLNEENDLEYVADQLTNGVGEGRYSRNEFINQISKNTNFDKQKIGKIYDVYLKMDGRQRVKLDMNKHMFPFLKKMGLTESSNDNDTIINEFQRDRQLRNPDTEMMVVKNGKVQVIDKKDWKKYKRKGYLVAESESVNESSLPIVDKKYSIAKVDDGKGNTWYVKKIDSTHMFMANDPKYLKKDRPTGVMAHHIGQHRDEPYYSELRSWLKESVNEARDFLVYNVQPKKVEAFLKKYKKVEPSMKPYLKGNIMKAYVKWLDWKNKNEDKLGGRPEKVDSDAFGSKTFYKFDGLPGWANVFQYLYKKQNEIIDKHGKMESVNEAKYTDQTGTKSSLLRNSEFFSLLNQKEKNWIRGNDVKIYKDRFGFIFTDGKMEMVANLKKPMSIIKSLGRARNEIKKLYNQNESVNEASGEFVVYVEKDNGRKKLLHTKKSQRAANMFMSKNADKILNKSGIRSIGSMSKDQWEKKEAQFAENIKKSDMKTVTKKEWDRTHKDYKGMIKGQPYMMWFDKKTQSTVYGPVQIKESVNEGISVFDERHFGKKGIIIMIDDNGKKVSAIFKDKKNADKYNRNKESDLKALLQLAKKTPYPKAIDEGKGDFGGWVAIYKGKRLEIDKNEANGIYGAKQIAIKKLKVPKSKQGLLAIAPAVEESVVNEAELKLGVKYTNKQGKEGFIQTGGSKNPKDWFWYDGKTKHPYTKVKRELKPSKDQKKTGFGDYLKQGGRVWDNVNPSNEESVNEAVKKGKKYGDWTVTQYEPVKYDDYGAPNGGRIKIVNQKTGNDLLIQNDLALRGSKWYISVNRRTIKDTNPEKVIQQAIKNSVNEGKITKTFHFKGKTSTDIDEIDADFSRQGIKSNPDFNNNTITVTGDENKIKKIVKFHRGVEESAIHPFTGKPWDGPTPVSKYVIPNVGEIDLWILKSLYLKNPKLDRILGNDEKAFMKKPDVVVIGVFKKQGQTIWTDGKQEFEMNIKHEKLVKPLRKARKKIRDHFSKIKYKYKGDKLVFEKIQSVNEARRKVKLGVIHKAAKKGSFPVSLVVVKNSKVIDQELVNIPEAVPAAFKVIQRKHKGAIIHIEDSTGRRLLSFDGKYLHTFESVNETKDLVTLVKGRTFDLGRGHFPTGLVVYNRAEEENGDWKKLAHISHKNNKITWYDKKLPRQIKSYIETLAKKHKGYNESVNEGKDPEIITQLRDVMENGYQKLKDPKTGRKVMVDSFSASAMVKVYDALKNPSVREKYVNSGIFGMQKLAFKFVK